MELRSDFLAGAHAAAVAIRDVPGMFRQSMDGLPHERWAELTSWRPRGSAWSAVEHAAHTTSVLHAFTNRLVRVLAEEHAELCDVHIEAPMAGFHQANIDAVLGHLGAEAERLGRVLEGATLAAWSHVAELDGEEVTPAELVDRASREAAHHLYAFDGLLGPARATTAVRDAIPATAAPSAG